MSSLLAFAITANNMVNFLSLRFIQSKAEVTLKLLSAFSINFDLLAFVLSGLSVSAFEVTSCV